MDRRQKIIVSVVGIFIVLLALVGITYGYFLTQIQGNTNTNSISITTANLRLVYDDGTTEILTKNNIVPDTTVATKDFTVTNEGDSDISEYQVYLENVINDFTRTQDVKLEVTCEYEKEDGSTGDCNGYNSTYPTTNTKLISNSIAQGEVHTYALSVVYEEANLDQSVDMGKTLKGKVQIYDPKDIVTLTGTVNVTNPVTNADYFVELQSVPKTSEIVNNTYTIPGVEPGNHTLYVKYRLNGATTTVASKAITVSKGSAASISSDGTSIVINDKTESTEVDVSVSGTTITLSGGEISDEPIFGTGTLANKIVEKAKANLEGRTIYSKTPLTPPAVESSGHMYKTSEVILSSSNYYLTVYSSVQNKYWTYATDYYFDESTGKFTLTDPKVCLYNDSNLSDNTEIECDKLISTMVSEGQKIYLPYSDTVNAVKSDKTLGNTKNLNRIWLIDSAPASSSSTITMQLRELTPNFPYATEKVLSETTDDYGVSYYYRGGVEDNYVNFAGLCWRIVRIEGDGSVKLILEDRNFECDNDEFTGDWSDGEFYDFGMDYNYRPNLINYSNNLSYESLINSFQGFQGMLSEKISTKYLGETISDKLKVDEWCYDENSILVSEIGYKYDEELDEEIEVDDLTEADYWISEEVYGAYVRIIKNKQPSYKCTGTKLTKFKDNTDMYVGTLTADEISFAGASNITKNTSHYLINDFIKNNNVWISWWSLSPSDYYYNSGDDAMTDGRIAVLAEHGILEFGSIGGGPYTSRPAITLKAGTIVTEGEGTLDKPYIIG